MFTRIDYMINDELIDLVKYILSEFECDKCKYNDRCMEYVDAHGIEYCQMASHLIRDEHEKLEEIRGVI